MDQTIGHTANNNVLAREFLTFTLGDEEYGIDILKVQEIRGYDTVTKVPSTPAFIKGVINLRGTIVPIADLRVKFELGQVTYDEFTVVIILHVLDRVVGIVVDGVSDVVSLRPDQVSQPPEFGAAMDTQYLLGLGTIDNRMLILVDIEKLISRQDMALVDSPAA